jgi:hypothetical protein
MGGVQDSNRDFGCIDPANLKERPIENAADFKPRPRYNSIFVNHSRYRVSTTSEGRRVSRSTRRVCSHTLTGTGDRPTMNPTTAVHRFGSATTPAIPFSSSRVGIPPVFTLS